MHVLKARNVHQALPEAIRHLHLTGIRRESRNGPVLVADGPVATVYDRPMERVVFWSQRDANPVFHLMESLWMLAGRRDVAFPSMFNSTFGQFSDDGATFNGAYGYRWRKWFERNQLAEICLSLIRNPDCRRQVLTMWDPRHDLSSSSKDIPCNTHAYFTRRTTGELDMTVCCRSNDIIWGAYGANAVHFGFLLEYMAARIDCPPGRYVQFSNNWHGYLKTLNPLLPLMDEAEKMSRPWCPYEDAGVRASPLILPEEVEHFDRDLSIFLEEGLVSGIRTRFLRKTVWPLMKAYLAFKEDSPKRFSNALSIAEDCEAQDWHLAAIQWFSRRRERAEEKAKEAAA